MNISVQIMSHYWQVPGDGIISVLVLTDSARTNAFVCAIRFFLDSLRYVFVDFYGLEQDDNAIINTEHFLSLSYYGLVLSVLFSCVIHQSSIYLCLSL